MTNEINNNDDNDYIDYDIHSKYCTYACEEPPDTIAFNGRCIIYIKSGWFLCYQWIHITNFRYSNIY